MQSTPNNPHQPEPAPAKQGLRLHFGHYLAGVMVAFVLMMAGYAYLSSQTPDQTLTKDAWGEAMRYDQRKQALQRARALADPIRGEYSTQQRALVVSLPPQLAPGYSGGTLSLSSTRLDGGPLRIPLPQQLRQGSFSLPLAKLPPGHWHAEIELTSGELDYLQPVQFRHLGPAHTQTEDANPGQP